MSNDYENTSWEIINKYFSDNPSALVEHHLDSYNLFYNKQIFNIFQERNPIKIRKSYIEKLDTYKFQCDIYLGGKSASKIHFGKPIIYDNNNIHYMFPNEARLRNMTYGITIYYDADVEFTITNEKGEKETGNQSYSKILLGKFPIMVQSNLCSLKGLDRMLRFNLGECKNDYGGYFIIDGKEKVIVPQEKFADNMMYIRKNNEESKYTHTAVIRNVSEDASKPVRTLKIHIVRPDQKYSNHHFVVEVPNVRKPIPLFILFRALGIISDKKILEFIVQDTEKNESLLDYFIPSIHDTHEILNQHSALHYIKTFTKGKTLHHSLEILSNYLFPQFGEQNYIQKAYFLGHMTFSLLKVFLNMELPTDRDSFSFKRIEVTGNLIYDLFNEYFTLYQKQIFLNIDKDINYHYKTQIELGKLTIDNTKEIFDSSFINKYTKDRTVESGFKKAFKGNWGASSHTKRPGVLQDVNRLSRNSFISNLRKLNLPLDSSAKVVEPRLCHSSQYGIIDPIDTPDGGNCGLHKHLTICSYITNGYSSFKMLEWMKKNIEFQQLEEVDPKDIYGKVKLFLNGRWIGICHNIYEIVMLMRNCRRIGLIPLYTSISYKVSQKSIYVFTDYGRLCRPLYYITENQKINLPTNISHLNWQEIISGKKNTDINTFNFKENLFYKLEDLYGKNNNMDEIFNNNRAIIDLVDTNETESLMIAHNNTQIIEKQKLYTHLELHNSLMFGYMGNMVIFPEHNQLPRNLFSCGQSKQAASLFHTNYQHRFDKSSIVLHYGQEPLVKSRYLSLFKNDEHPYGVNVIVAIACYTGYNVEDAILINRGAVDRGLFRTTYYNTYETREEIQGVGGGESNIKIINPYKENVTNINSNYNYEHLNDDGMIDEETPVSEKTVIIGKAIYDEYSETYTDSSITTKKAQNGIVDKTFLSSDEDGKRIAKVRVREERIPAIGDKMCSRAGQKGTIGLIIDEDDMPFTSNGVRPDLIINPHAIPSRMTIGQLIECVMGKACLNSGMFGDTTAYCNDKNGYKIFGDMLAKNGYNSHGNEILYNGMTGEQIETEIFIGPTYYLRLKHMVKDKINYRAKGPKMSLTKQPVKGRANDGGLRIGEMERDGVLGHGASKFLNESMLERGDLYYLAICNQTGTIACYNEEQNIFFSPFADGPVKFDGTVDDELKIKSITQHGRSFSIVKVPYSFKLLIQELQTMNIQMRIITDDNIEQIMNMSYTNDYQKLNKQSTGVQVNDLNSIANVISRRLRGEESQEENIRNQLIRGAIELPNETQDELLNTYTPAYNKDVSPPYAPGLLRAYTQEEQNDIDNGIRTADDIVMQQQNIQNKEITKLRKKEIEEEYYNSYKVRYPNAIDNIMKPFFKYYKKRYPNATNEIINMAYDKFLDDGEFIDANNILIPEDFEKEDSDNIKKKTIIKNGGSNYLPDNENAFDELANDEYRYEKINVNDNNDNNDDNYDDNYDNDNETNIDTDNKGININDINDGKFVLKKLG